MTTRGPSSDFENPKGEDTHTAMPSGRDVFGNRIIYRPNQGDNGNVGPSPTSREQFEQEPFRPSKPRELNVRDVFAFTVNNMVGTGIYTTPPVVLYLTNSKYVALALWIVGFLYTAISMVIYLELSRKMPHTGGELVYLDETLPRPRLLSYTIYSFYAILIYNDATNSMQFAKQTLTFLSDNPADPSLNPWFLRFMAFVVLSFVCLLHYFSSRAGQDLSQILACAKITLLVVLIFGGIPRAVNHYTSDWAYTPQDSNSATAFLYILFSFSGWDNATVVGGEIAEHKILKKGAISAISLVGLLYFLVNLVFLLAVPHNALHNPLDDTYAAYAPLFFGNTEKAHRAWAFMIAISALGSLVAFTYTSSRLKLAIGKANILPWSRLWRSSSPVRINSNGKNTSTPQGGLIIHFLFSVAFIYGTAGFANLSEGISFPGNIHAYASGWVGVFIGIGFPLTFLSEKSRLLKLLCLEYRNIPSPSWERLTPPRSHLLKHNFYWFFTGAFLVANIFIVVVSSIPSKEKGQIKGWINTAIVGGVITFACLYYLLTISFSAVRPHNQLLGMDEETQTLKSGKSILSYAGVFPEIFEENIHDEDYGTRRHVVVFLKEDDSKEPKKSFLYWIFGGSKAKHRRNFGLPDIWDQMMGKSS